MAETDAHQERFAHLERMLDDLSDVVARQAEEIAVLERRVRMLLERTSAAEGEGGVTLTDQRPPHW